MINLLLKFLDDSNALRLTARAPYCIKTLKRNPEMVNIIYYNLYSSLSNIYQLIIDKGITNLRGNPIDINTISACRIFIKKYIQMLDSDKSNKIDLLSCK